MPLPALAVGKGLLSLRRALSGLLASVTREMDIYFGTGNDWCVGGRDVINRLTLVLPSSYLEDRVG